MKKNICLLFMALSLVACGSSTPFQRGKLKNIADSNKSTSDGSADVPPTVSLNKAYFEQNILPALEKSCTMCHGNPASTFEKAQALVKVGSPDESLLYLIPQGLAQGHRTIWKSDSAQIAVMKNWIEGKIAIQ